jgi:hypothetical protein
MTLNVAIFLMFTICFAVNSCEMTKNITIVSPGFLGFGAFPSLSYVGPAIDTGIERLRNMFPKYNWTSKRVNHEIMTSCNAVLDNIQDVLSRWYYTERDPDSLNLLITTGILEEFP